MTFQDRYSKLNDKQKQAVDQIDGPLLVIAGPGTGKTELLSMRTAQILRQTDSLPSNILCLTFTDSGAINMRQRLREIIGEDAYKVAIHTFHSFGVEIINQNREYFFRGGEFQPADQLSQYQILRELFDKLDWQHPLASKNGDDYVNLSDVRSIISEFKRSGLTGDELRLIIQDNQRVIDEVAEEIADIFSSRISKSAIEPFAKLAQKAATIGRSNLPAGISSYSSVLSLSIAHASQEAIDTGKTNAITAWKNQWCEKDVNSRMVLKDSRHIDKLLATVDLYDQYEAGLQENSLYDYDDMILNVIQAVENHADLRANLQERFQYMLVDEFQDTNLAQLRLLFNLSSGDQPNVMAVGDDDQAIFSFQGADIGNIQRFREYYKDPQIIVLTDNYRSSENILDLSRQVITQSQDRLENTTEGLSKQLTAWYETGETEVKINQYLSPGSERAGIAKQIANLINIGVPADQITILARQHSELIGMLPYLNKHNILVNYERRDNALEHPLALLIEQMAKIIVGTSKSDHDTVNALLPELIAHPVFDFRPEDIWKLSLAAYRNRQFWLEAMQANTTFKPLADWLIQQNINSVSLSFEQQIDQLIGTTSTTTQNFHSPTVLSQANVPPAGVTGLSPVREDCSTENSEPKQFVSPIYNYFFSSEKLQEKPDAYLDALEALRTIRDQLCEHHSTEAPKLEQMLEFIDLYKQLGATLTIVRHRAGHLAGHINLMTAHKSKGQQFLHVFVIGAVDNNWGERVSKRSRNIRYPANLTLQSAGNHYDERIRLFYVAMTRARNSLNISYATSNNNGKETEVASFLSTQPINGLEENEDIATLTEHAETEWYGHLTKASSPELKDLLAPQLEKYKLSATHINNFIDLPNGGPQTFLLNNLLKFPKSKSTHSVFGTTVHTALQQAHNNVIIDGKLPDIELILDNFSKDLLNQHLSQDDYVTFNDKGRQALTAFISSHGESFTANQKTELNFDSQGVVLGSARLTGKLDLVDIDKTNKTIRVTDYKTGKASRDWKGKADYEKVKLHKYRQQLMLYQLLAENSRDWSYFQFTGGVLQFVEPDRHTGEILALEQTFASEELDEFRRLVEIIWHKIINLELPDTSNYEPNYKGILQFEKDLLEDS